MSMNNKAALTIALMSLICAGCATTGGGSGENEPPVIDSETQAETAAAIEAAAPAAEGGSKQEEGEVPLSVAQTEQPEQAPPKQAPEEVIVQGRNLTRPAVIHDLVSEAQTMLRDVELQYVFTGKGKRETLRGRPVAF